MECGDLFADRVCDDDTYSMMRMRVSRLIVFSRGVDSRSLDALSFALRSPRCL